MKLTKEEIYTWATRNYVLSPETLDSLKFQALCKTDYDMNSYLGATDSDHTAYMYFKFLGAVMRVLENLEDERQNLNSTHKADRNEILSLKIMIQNQKDITTSIANDNVALIGEIKNLKDQMYLSKCRVQIMADDDDGWLLSRGVK
jgi:hypothetical protein